MAESKFSEPGWKWRIAPRSAGTTSKTMQLAQHGLKFATPEACVTSLSPDGRAVTLCTDARKSADSIGKFSAKDAAKWPELQESLRKMGSVIGEALRLTPPDIDNPNKGDLWGMFRS